MHYAPKHFRAEELVPPSIFRVRGEKSIQLISPLLLIMADAIRERHGKMLCNTWHMSTANPKSQSGLRTIEFLNNNQPLDDLPKEEIIRLLKKWEGYQSLHKYGMALDLTPVNTTAAMVIEDLRNNPAFFSYIHFIEIDRDWVHIDVRNISGCQIWSPDRGLVAWEK